MNSLIEYLTSWQGIVTSTVVSLLAWFSGTQLVTYHRTGGTWPRLARFLARPRVADWLIRRSLRTPYSHLVCNRDGTNRVVAHGYQLQPGESFYMRRFWLFNPYSREDNIPTLRITLKLGRWQKVLAFPISIRVHHIMREDGDRDLHSHPWNARSVILKGHYIEERESSVRPTGKQLYLRRPGATLPLRCEDYHRICEVGPAGTWTLFISGPWRQVWCFKVDGNHIPWRDYLQMED